MAKVTKGIRFAKPTRKTVWALIVLALWCVFIFSMSARVADDSDALSLGVAGYLLNLFVPDFGNMSITEQLALAESINHPIRKLAHFSEYAVLGVLAYVAVRVHVVCAGELSGGFGGELACGSNASESNALRPNLGEPSVNEPKVTGCSAGYRANLIVIPLLSWVFCILYAASDEIHQIFVPGRACMLTDVCIDSAGALLGIALASAAFVAARAAKRKEMK